MDVIEALVNSAIGLCVSWALTVFWLGFSPAQSAGITAVFFVASFTRGWIVRAAFRRME